MTAVTNMNHCATLIDVRFYLLQCGQPQTVGNCNVCGAVIGGARHTPESGNKPVSELVMLICQTYFRVTIRYVTFTINPY